MFDSERKIVRFVTTVYRFIAKNCRKLSFKKEFMVLVAFRCFEDKLRLLTSFPFAFLLKASLRLSLEMWMLRERERE